MTDVLKSSFNLAQFEGNWGDDKTKDLVFLARTAEAAERYDDMCQCMSTLVKNAPKGTEFTVDQRNLLSVAYKNVIGARRASWRTLNAESQDEKNANLITNYKVSVENELKAICKDVLELLGNNLISEVNINKIKEDNRLATDKDAPNKGHDGEAQVFYLKMAGDYYRYLAEAVTDKDHEKRAADYYKRAFELSEMVLEPTHPIRLGLALNYSVCFYEILKDKKKACQLAKDAFDEAISKLDKLEEADYKDSTLIMQLLRDNLTLWTSTDNEDGDNPDTGAGGD
jgi:hypothetical protein